MVFFYTFTVFALYIVLSFLLINVIYKFYKQNDKGRKSILDGFVKGRSLGYSAEDNVISNAIGIMIAGFIMSSLFSLLYFLIAFFIYTVIWS